MKLTSDQIFTFRQNLFRDLRNELGHLKTCQTAIVVLGVTGSGVFLGLLKPQSFEEINPYLVLLPLIILLPLWIIFYDKARTIARIVGFLRVQENLALENSSVGLIGWESAMKEYWKVRDKYDESEYDEIFLAAKSKNTNYNTKIRESIINSTYWSSVYSLFWIFSFSCLFLSFFRLNIENGIRFTVFLWFGIVLIIAGIGATWKPFHREFNKKIFIFIYGSSEIEKYTPRHRRFYTVLWNLLVLIIVCDLVTILSFIIFYSIVPPSEEFFSIVIFMMFGSLFIMISMIAFWMLSGLIKGYDGRYSYKSFELRWEIALRGEDYVKKKYKSSLSDVDNKDELDSFICKYPLTHSHSQCPTSPMKLTGRFLFPNRRRPFGRQ